MRRQGTAVAAPARILIVDDEPFNRDVLAQELELLEHELTAVHGRDALEVLRREAVDLILLDIMMPEIDGFEVLRRLKNDAELRHIPVIMISALDDIDSVVRCIELGADDYLPKPFDPVLLKARIGACLEKKRWRDQEVAYLERIEGQMREIERERAAPTACCTPSCRPRPSRSSRRAIASPPGATSRWPCCSATS